MAEFASFWVGDPLSKVEQTCLSSFIYHNHSLTLFVYDMDLKVPKGVKKVNAEEIMPKERIFKVDNSYGPFADMFRYRMIQQTGLTWTDTDNICNRPDWDFDKYLFGKQGGNHDLCANGIIRAPKDSPFINEMVEVSDSFDKSQITWGEIGPQLLTKTLKKYNLEEYIQPPKVFYPVDYWDWSKIWEPEYRFDVVSKYKRSHTIQIWNQYLNRNGINKNRLPAGSAIDYFYDKYVN